MSEPLSNDVLVSFTYGEGDNKVSVMIPLDVLFSFRVMKDMNADLGLEDPSEIIGLMPTIYNVNRESTRILFTKDELQQFFNYVDATEESIITKLNDDDIPMPLLAKFINLANALDNEIYLNALIKYTAHIIRSGTMTN